ncbi:MAG TPA: isoprenylcysteine carboxylmethyltransferase family protein [Verrucomicrobiae bacterium]|nr:isoprenylcysteine carboxylmethyltransferase family protein [Verrucomicrobiae bacterium]
MRTQWLLASIEGGYYHWRIVAFYVVVGGLFVWGLLRPRTSVQWQSAGVAYAWLTALFAEMYGLPVSMYVLASLTGRWEFVHDYFHGHAWAYLFGWGDGGATICDWIGRGILATGMVIVWVAWRQFYRARGQLVRDGLYRRVRHPQYAGFLLFITGCLVDWPTVPTLLMFPTLAVTYYRLARSEEADAFAKFGEEYRAYQHATGMFWPGPKHQPATYASPGSGLKETG